MEKSVYVKWGFLQDSYSPVRFCITEISVAKLLEESKGYRMGEAGKRCVSRLLVDIYQE